MSAGVPVVPANLFIADVIEATGEVFELPPLLRVGVHAGGVLVCGIRSNGVMCLSPVASRCPDCSSLGLM